MVDGVDVQKEGDPKEDNTWKVSDYCTNYRDFVVVF
jgi:hypothetical protein